jgi:hypothetical protein
MDDRKGRVDAGPRRIVFFDVENANRPEHTERMLAHLELDRPGSTTKIVAIGNWRVVSQQTARLFARRGAELVHSAPALGVKDWSDMRIAAVIGLWLGTASPGDVVDVVTDDQAFDAVGDVATNLGVVFRRCSHRRLVEQGLAPAPRPPARPRSARRR